MQSRHCGSNSENDGEHLLFSGEDYTYSPRGIVEMYSLRLSSKRDGSDNAVKIEE